MPVHKYFAVNIFKTDDNMERCEKSHGICEKSHFLAYNIVFTLCIILLSILKF